MSPTSASESASHDFRLNPENRSECLAASVAIFVQSGCEDGDCKQLRFEHGSASEFPGPSRRCAERLNGIETGVLRRPVLANSRLGPPCEIRCGSNVRSCSLGHASRCLTSCARTPSTRRPIRWRAGTACRPSSGPAGDSCRFCTNSFYGRTLAPCHDSLVTTFSGLCNGLARDGTSDTDVCTRTEDRVMKCR